MAQVNDILNRLEGVKPTGSNKYQAKCPHHKDNKPSLSIKDTDDKILLYCHAGCSVDNILHSIGLTERDLFKESENINTCKPKKQIEKVYQYTDMDSNVIHEKVRYSDKSFANRHIENDKTIWNMKGVTPVIYNLPKVVQAINKNETIYLVEGEKDADRLNGLGLTATTNFEGAGRHKFKKAYAKYFVEANVVVVQDSDESGRDAADTIVNILFDVAKSIKNIDLGKISKYKGFDVSDYFDMGYTKEEFLKMVEEAPAINKDNLKHDLEDGSVCENDKFFIVPKNKQNIDAGYRVNVSLLAMYIKQTHDMKIYKGQLRVKTNNYYGHVENIKGLISSEIPEQYRLPSNIRDCEELLLIDNELTLNDEEIAGEKYISFKNGVLDTETMEFKTHDDISTHSLVFINQVGCNWNPNAKADNITDLFFNSTTGGKQSDIDYLYQILGVLISGYRSFKNIFYFTGAKDTGKSRYLALAERLLTNPDRSTDFSNIGLKVLTDETSKEFSRIIGKRANIAAETPDIKITNDTLLKQLSGGDTVNAQIKFKDSVDFKNKAMLIFAGNTIPKFFISDKSSIGERLLIYKFKTRIQKKDQIKEIEQKMNLEYVALKAVEQLRNFIKNNQEFTVPEEIEQHREEMLQDSDTIYKFYKTCTTTTDNDSNRISNRALYDAFLNFLVDEGYIQTTWDNKPNTNEVKVSQYVFTAQVKKHHGEDKHKRNIKYKNSKEDCFICIKLKGKDEPRTDEQSGSVSYEQSKIVNLY